MSMELVYGHEAILEVYNILNPCKILVRGVAIDVLVGVAPPARIFPADILFYCIPLALFAKNKYNKK